MWKGPGRAREGQRVPVCGKGKGSSRGAACAFPAPAQRQLEPIQLLCVNRMAVGPGRGEDGARGMLRMASCPGRAVAIPRAWW